MVAIRAIRAIRGRPYGHAWADRWRGTLAGNAAAAYHLRSSSILA
jgi:hypothetical protein